jgi:hypothetical protein
VADRLEHQFRIKQDLVTLASPDPRAEATVARDGKQWHAGGRYLAAKGGRADDRCIPQIRLWAAARLPNHRNPIWSPFGEKRLPLESETQLKRGQALF